jgi:hypothetical protein
VVSFSCFGQFYTGIAIDPNKAFGIIENPRTKQDHRGLHFDIETGFVENDFAFYLLYGRFEAANYQKLALGADYFVLKDEELNLGLEAVFPISGKSRVIYQRPLPFRLAWTVNRDLVVLSQAWTGGTFSVPEPPRSGSNRYPGRKTRIEIFF